MKEKLEPWTPAEFRAFLRDQRDVSLNESDRGLFFRLATDLDMRRFWDWLDKKNDEVCDQGYELNPLSLFWAAVRGTAQLGKPSNLPPKRKQKYLTDVQAHASALIDLLRDTAFDVRLHEWCNLAGLEISDLGNISDYPHCTLTEQLEEVVLWTQQPDHHDSAGNPTWMTSQSGESARKYFLAAHLVWTFDQLLDTRPPIELLAVLMTTSLNAEPEITPAAAQKIVERLKERKKEIVYTNIESKSSTATDLFIQSVLKNKR